MLTIVFVFPIEDEKNEDEVEANAGDVDEVSQSQNEVEMEAQQAVVMEKGKQKLCIILICSESFNINNTFRFHSLTEISASDVLSYKWIDINTDFERKYGMKKDISKQVAEEDLTTLIEFIGAECTDEDEKYLANTWLDKFNRYWEKNPRAEHSKPKRKIVPMDRLKANAAGPQIKASKAKVCGV